MESPSIWCFRGDADGTLLFLKELHDAFFVEKARSILIDHSNLSIASPEAILVVTATLEKLTEYSPRTKLQARFRHTSPAVLSVLNEVGYLSYFGLGWQTDPKEDRHFLALVSDLETNTEVVARLVLKFHREGHLEMERCKRLVKGLIECMQNVNHHAYKKAKGRRLMGRWWLLGYVDVQSGQIYFAFYDQGVGMPTTLRFKMLDRWAPPLLSRTDAELILAAFAGNFSSTQQKNRGFGLPRLKRLVDEAPDGELFVHSEKVQVVLKPRGRPTSQVTKMAMEGTLLVWQVVVERKQEHDDERKDSQPHTDC